MKKVVKFVTSCMLLLTLMLSAFPIVGKANSQRDTPLQALEEAIAEGQTTGSGVVGEDSSNAIVYTKYYVYCQDNTYDYEEGGYAIWGDLVEAPSNNSTYARTGCIKPEVFEKLTKGAKRDFLSDVLSICNNIVAFNATAERQTDNSNPNAITADTVNAYAKLLQNLSGAGSQLIASLLSETKPDYATANKIYMPFSGVIGTILGLLSILIIALLGVSMGIDIAYITIPAFQIFCGPPETGKAANASGKTEDRPAVGRLISIEAQNAVAAATNTGDSGQNGSGNKMAIGVYFKHRWKGLVMLGICLLYLIQGQIYSFVAWVLDLVSGFAGF